MLSLLYTEGPQMYSNPQKLSSSEVVGLRREVGHWLKELRESRGLSQRALAERVGAEYYTFISQLEGGRGRIPPDRYVSWAKALSVEPKLFVRTVLRYYDPVTYGILFADEDEMLEAGSKTKALGPVKSDPTSAT